MASKLLSSFSSVAVIGTMFVAKKGLDATWRAATGKPPPGKRGDPDAEMTEAVLWAMFSAAGITVVRIVAARRAAAYLARSTGKASKSTQAAERLTT